MSDSPPLRLLSSPHLMMARSRHARSKSQFIKEFSIVTNDGASSDAGFEVRRRSDSRCEALAGCDRAIAVCAYVDCLAAAAFRWISFFVTFSVKGNGGR
jgi:hypothetical protein